MHFTVPKGPNERLLVPAPGKVAPAANANRERLNETGCAISGRPLAELRAGLRRLLLTLAKRDPDDGRPIVAAAHQPGLPHPGILFKYAVLNRLASDVVPFDIVVESDTVEVVSARVPTRRGESVSIESHPLAHVGPRVVIGRAPKPERRVFEHGLSEMRRAAATLDSDEILEALDRFAAIHREEYPQHNSLAAMLTAYRRRYFPTPRVHEVVLSSLCESDEFRAFAAAIIEEAARFLSTHNEALARYRVERRIRTTINPFPDLRADGTMLQVPFWHVGDDGRRSPVFVELRGKHTTLHAYRTPLGGWTTRPQLDELLRRTPLRPKAVTLTMFLRLCVADLFLHGVSGANYDNATDMVIRDFFGIEPPAYGVASMTVRLPLTFDDGLEQRVRELASRARRMTWNPDEFLPDANPLKGEKKRLLKNAGERLTREEHETLETIRQRLLGEIAAERRANDHELDAAQKALVAQQRLGARDFPYFLYPLPVLEAAMATPTTTHMR